MASTEDKTITQSKIINDQVNISTAKKYFENTVRLFPDHTALIYKELSLTYQELNLRANKLAWYLVNQCANDNPRGLYQTYITLCLPKSIDYMVSVWAIMKLGAIYVPIDTSLPADRLHKIFRSCSPSLCICDDQFIAQFPTFRYCDRISMNHCVNDIKQQQEIDLVVETQPDDSAYVIFTSGSTGNPKGVEIRQKSLLNLLTWFCREFKFDSYSTFIHKTPSSFDVSIWEIFLPAYLGSKQVISEPNGHKDLLYLIHMIIKFKISCIHFVPPFLEAFLTILESDTDLRDKLNNTLRFILCGGDKLSTLLAKKYYDLLSVQLYNMYGPSETCVDIIYHKVSSQHEYNDLTIPIGKPILNSKAYICDQNLTILPPNTPGELILSGRGLAVGYLNMPDQTKKSFIRNTLSKEFDDDYTMLYRTGDIVKLDNHHDIVFVGRNDFQVKIRGYRIELEEIRTHLSLFSLILSCVIHVKNINKQPEIIAYYISQDNQKIPESQLSDFLRETLPEYMIPRFYIRLEKFPLLSSGKISYQDLPVPERLSQDSPQTVDIDQSTLSNFLISACADILGTNLKSLELSAYDAGINSIQIFTMITAIHNTFKIWISPKDFSYFSLQQIADKYCPSTDSFAKSQEQNHTSRTFFLRNQEKDLYCNLVCPMSETKTVVILVHPFGQEYMKSHRIICQLSKELLHCGIASLRFDLSGCGDSSGVLNHYSIDDWVDDVQFVHSHLHTQENFSNIVYLGLRLGATICLKAITGQAPSALVLWEPILDGQQYLRELMVSHNSNLRAQQASYSEITTIASFSECLGYPLSDRFKTSLAEHDIHKQNIELTMPTLLLINGDDSNHAENSLHSQSTKLVRCDDQIEWSVEDSVGLMPTHTIDLVIEWLMKKESTWS